ncbi:MAG: LamG-like jellyroll fold domain-containing protein [Planctomycetota bacterium]|nr:LamG-like jellyroll fold domain-containing protein [Planctomycetota bacterium]
MNHIGPLCIVVATTLTLAVAQRPTHEWDFSKAGMARSKGSLRGPGALLQSPLPEALVFRSREDRFVVSNSIRSARLPKSAITVAAWVTVDAPRTWGGLFSALQDNGAFEKGLLLGYSGSKFCFALASKGADDGDGKLTYLTGRSSFVQDRFQHVVGTYDGKEMRLYVDGELEASSKAQKGEILYPRRAVVEIGAYHDDDEDFPFRGLLGQVRVFSKALNEAEVRAQRASAAQRFQWPAISGAVRAHRWQASESALSRMSGEVSLTQTGKLSFDGTVAPVKVQFTGAEALRGTLPPLPGRTRSIEVTALLGSVRRRSLLARFGELELGLLDGKLRFGIGERFATVGEKLAPFRWYHIVATWDGSLLRIYLDGKQRAFERSDPQVGPVGGKLTIGDGFSGGLHELNLSNALLSSTEVVERYRKKKALFPKPLGVEIGPYASFLTPNRAEIRWQTPAQGRAWVELVDVDGKVQRVAVRNVRGTSVAQISRLRSGLSYDYRILLEDAAGKQHATASYRLDTAFAYADEHVATSLADAGPDVVKLVSAMPKGPGYSVVLGVDASGSSHPAALVADLAKYTEQQIVVVIPGAGQAQALRRSLAARQIYGTRVTVVQAAFDDLPLGSDLANAVVVAKGAKISQRECRRILRPEGGKIITASGEVLHTAVQVAGTGDWTHQYGSGANTASSNDGLVSDALELQWFGKPGPRPMMDRGARSPAPLYTNGRLFIHGDRRLFGLDAYNGTILWAHEIPQLRRVNMPRDCSNLNVLGDDLWVAVTDRLWRLDAQTGAMLDTLEIPEALRPIDDPAWGFVHATPNSVIGTATTLHATYRGAEGEWYDKPGVEAEAVLGSAMFAVHPESGELLWSYTGSHIVHPTITVDAETIYFVEDRKPSKESLAKGRLVSQDGKNQFLVAIEAKTGNKLWERRYDFRDFSQVFYLSLSTGVLVAVGTSTKYHAHGFEASTGQPKWQHSHAVKKDHHGGAMQHPVILDGVVYVEQKALDLQKGKVVREDIPGRRGCGTMTASGQTLFFRHYDHTIWNPTTKKLTVLPGIRSGCWLSLIPAGGLLLAPESSSGCSCANPIQTSVAYRPRKK